MLNPYEDHDTYPAYVRGEVSGEDMWELVTVCSQRRVIQAKAVTANLRLHSEDAREYAMARRNDYWNSIRGHQPDDRVRVSDTPKQVHNFALPVGFTR